MGSDARTVTRGSILRVSYFFFEVVVGLFLMPFIIHSLGDRMYGLWMVIFSFLGFFWILDLGLSSAIERYVSRALGTEDFEEANAIINTTLALFFLIGLLALLVTVIVSLMAPVFFKDIQEVNLFRKLILILGFNTAVSFPMRVFTGLINAHLRFDLRAVISFVKLLLRAVLIVILFSMGYGIITLALITLGVSLLDYYLHFMFSRRVARYLKLSFTLIDKSRIRQLSVYSSFTFIGRIADRLRFGVDNFVIAAFVGLNLVTIYAIAARLIEYFISIIESAMGMTFPIFSRIEGRGDYESLKEKYILTTKISGYFAMLVGSSLIMYSRAFIERWMGEEYLSAYPVLVILAVPTMIALIQNPSIGLLYGTSKHKFFAISNSIEGVANLALSLILVRKFGIIGVAYGTAIPMVVIKLFAQPVYTCRIVKLPVFRYYTDVLLPVMAKSLGYILVFWWLFNKFIVPDYLRLAVLASGECFFFMIAIFFIGFNRSERAYFKRVIFNRA